MRRLLSLPFAAACAGDPVDSEPLDTDDTDVTYGDVRAITSRGCGCHPTAGHLSLADDWYDGVVGVAAYELPTMDRIEPGDPDASYLVLKLRGTHLEAGGSGVQMPAEGALDPVDRARIEAWVAAGAPR